MITITFAGDESGDVSFNFGKGASRYFVQAVISTNQPQLLRDELDNVRQNLGLPANYEFGFNAMGTSSTLRQKVFIKVVVSIWFRQKPQPTRPPNFTITLHSLITLHCKWIHQLHRESYCVITQ